jgi:hypothetical protein
LSGSEKEEMAGKGGKRLRKICTVERKDVTLQVELNVIVT